jgi:hypothetical protein
MLITFGSVNNLLAKSGTTINSKIQQGGPGEPYAEPTLKDLHEEINGRKTLLGRVPVLDTQFIIPRPITHASITFHGLVAFNSIAFYGRRAELVNSARYGTEFLGKSRIIFPYHFYQSE